MNKTKWQTITEHWYMCVGCCFRCKAIGYRHPMVDGDDCGGSFGRRNEIQQLLKEREQKFLEVSMNHKTQWFELSHLVWRCDGCSKQCQSCGVKPPDDVDCDESDSRIRVICNHDGGFYEQLGGA